MGVPVLDGLVIAVASWNSFRVSRVAIFYPTLSVLEV
jgi:hypothetical protein